MERIGNCSRECIIVTVTKPKRVCDTPSTICDSTEERSEFVEPKVTFIIYTRPINLFDSLFLWDYLIKV